MKIHAYIDIFYYNLVFKLILLLISFYIAYHNLTIHSLTLCHLAIGTSAIEGHLPEQVLSSHCNLFQSNSDFSIA